MCGYVLVAHLLSLSAGGDAEKAEFFYWEMLFLTFPLGYMGGVLVGSLFAALMEIGLEIPLAIIQYGSIFLVWLVMTAIGFFQWFICLPKLFTWGKSLCKSKSQSS